MSNRPSSLLPGRLQPLLLVVGCDYVEINIIQTMLGVRVRPRAGVVSVWLLAREPEGPACRLEDASILGIVVDGQRREKIM